VFAEQEHHVEMKQKGECGDSANEKTKLDCLLAGYRECCNAIFRLVGKAFLGFNGDLFVVFVCRGSYF